VILAFGILGCRIAGAEAPDVMRTEQALAPSV
jgi:hypothetical protein